MKISAFEKSPNFVAKLPILHSKCSCNNFFLGTWAYEMKNFQFRKCPNFVRHITDFTLEIQLATTFSWAHVWELGTRALRALGPRCLPQRQDFFPGHRETRYIRVRHRVTAN